MLGENHLYLTIWYMARGGRLLTDSGRMRAATTATMFTVAAVTAVVAAAQG
jgi:hypothetical protein